MREILFRGKTEQGKWVEGFYYLKRSRHAGDKTFMFEKHMITTGIEETRGAYGENTVTFEYEVIPKTVGQYTGLTDKNGKKIFDGDIVIKSYTYHYYVNHQRRSQINTFMGQVVLDSGSYIMKEQGEFIGSSSNGEWLEVIGNIHDNPELLKGGE